MEPVPPLPLPVDALPESVRRFGDPKAPGPARTMAAKGLVPVKGADLVTLLVQLSADEERAVADAAGASLDKLPEGILLAACDAPIHPSILDGIASRFSRHAGVLEQLAQNHAVADVTMARIAERGSERLGEIIATNQQRLLGAPEIIEALYRNPATRMSTADRLIELAARHGLDLKGIPAYQAHVEAIRGQLIPEPTDEPLPGDAIFRAALEADSDEFDTFETDEEEGTEELKEDFRPLHFRIRDMSMGEKIRLSVVGNAAARALLVRDANRSVAMAAITSPRMSDAEAATVAHSREVADEVLRYIGHRREWLRNYEVRRALVFNPKTPIGTALQFVQHMRDHDLKALSRSRNIPTPIKTAANNRLHKKKAR